MESPKAPDGRDAVIEDEIGENQADGNMEECIEASSWSEYFKKAGIEPLFSDKMEEMKLAIPIKTNFPDAQIYRLPLGHAGGDLFTEPVIKYGDLFCPLTDLNCEKMFSPIKKDDVTAYVSFRLITLSGSSYGRCRNTVLTKKEYGSHFCEEDVESLDPGDKKVTKVEESGDGFVVNWIYHTHCGAAGYYKAKIKVGHDGTIKTLEESERFINCGKGKMF